MPSLTPTKGYSKTVLFSSGEGVTSTDFNLMQDLLLLRAVDWRDFPDMVASEANVLEGDVEAHIAGGLLLSKKAFVYPGGARFEIAGTNQSRVLGGAIAAYYLGAGDQAVAVAPSNPDPAAASSGVRMFWVPSSTDPQAVSFTHSPNIDPTNARIDLVTVKIEPVENLAADQVTRHFKSGVTGALTSSIANKRRAMRATFTLTEGTPAASPVAPALPSADDRVLYTVTMPAAAGSITNLHDWMFPLGRRRLVYTPAINSFHGKVAARLGTELERGSLEAAQMFIPCPNFGDPHTRILGFRLVHKLSAPSGGYPIVRLCRFDAGAYNWNDLEDLSSFFTYDGAARAQTHQLPRWPDDSASSGAKGPYWANGMQARTFGMRTAVTAGSYQGLALRVETGAAPSEMRGVLWAVMS